MDPLGNAGVPENVGADIVGHEKTTITYGLYSGGLSLAVKRETLNKLAYPYVVPRGRVGDDNSPVQD